MNYYNEFDPSAIAWLKELISAGAIPDGHIDTRSIVDVQPEDLDGFNQCHFFAGIGGWPYALELAGYSNVKGLWTGSCPCQPFSAAGKRKGTADARHLWPEMFRLVKACRPQYVLGEQVEAAIRLGWLDGVFGDLEGEGYACGAAVLGAHSVGAPHIRQRLYWGGTRRLEVSQGDGGDGPLQPVQREEVPGALAPSGGGTSGLADNDHSRHKTLQPGCADGICGERQFRGTRVGPERGGADGGLEHTPSNRRDERRPEPSGRGESPDLCGLGDPESGGRARECLRSNRDSAVRVAQADAGGLGDPDDPRPQGHGIVGERPRELSPWAASTVIPCADGKTRRISVEPALFPLAHGVPGRVGLLRGAGNAIVPQVAALFITSFMERE